MRRRGDRGVSTGTIVFLCMTTVVIAMTVLFLIRISEDDLSSLRNPVSEQIMQNIGTEQYEDDEVEFALDTVSLDTTIPVRDKLDESTDLMPIYLKLSVAGDIMAPRVIWETVTYAEGEADFSAVFVNIGERLEQADIVLATLETMMDDEKPYDVYNTPSQLLEALKRTGIQSLNLATEHIFRFRMGKP